MKLGDKVILSNPWYRESIEIIEKITPKGSIRVKGMLFDERGYQKGGDTWSRYSIKIADDESIRKITEEKYIISVIKKMHDCKGLSYDKAVKINNILEEKVVE